jgi:phage gp29-like protein
MKTNIFSRARFALKAAVKELRQRPITDEINTVSLYNRWNTYPSVGLTPEALATILKEADEGNISRQMELFEEIMEKDPHIFGAFQSRKLAVSKRDYQIISASEDKRDKDIAEYVRNVFNNIKRFHTFREDALDSVPKAFSAQQIMWKIDPANNVYIDRFELLHQKNFRYGLATDPKSDLNKIRRITDDYLVDGIELEPYKWFIPIVKARSGYPGRASIMRTVTWYYLFKNFDVKSWVQFAEVYGLPLRIGKYGMGAGETEKNDLLRALQTIAQDASAIISDTTKIEFIEAAQKASSIQLYSDLAEYCDAQNSKAILGHTGAIDSTPGKLGGETNAENVRFDLIQNDALSLDYEITDQIVIPLVNFQFGKQEKYPYYKTVLVPPKNRKEEQDILNNSRVPIGTKYYYETLGIPQPVDDEEVVTPNQNSSPFGNPFGLPVSAKEIAASDRKKKV